MEGFPEETTSDLLELLFEEDGEVEAIEVDDTQKHAVVILSTVEGGNFISVVFFEVILMLHPSVLF